jgi:RecB family exonuclease
MKVLWSTPEWARAVADLPVEGPLPGRTVLVPREAVAHALRRELIRQGRAGALAGTRFITTAGAAAEILQAAGVEFEPGEESLRPARLLGLFRGGLPLAHFPLGLLRDNPGWDEAFARTIGDLESAGFRPEDLDGAAAGQDAARLGDVAAVWRAADESAGPSWTAARIHVEAARVLESDPARRPFAGAVLAVASGHASAAQARFLRALPGVQLALLGARPVRAAYLARIQALFGAAAGDAVGAATAPRTSASERDLLASYLFEPPAVLADPSRPRSAGPDGTVDLEEHAGVEAELEATADWLTRQVLDGTPLEDIAVLVPQLDPLAALVAERLARLPWAGADDALAVHVAGGLPLTTTAGGARALAVVRALRAHLSADAVAAVLPSLRIAPAAPPDAAAPDLVARHLSHGAAMDLAWSLGTAGGNAAEPRRALDWAERAVTRERDLARLLDEARAAGDDGEAAGIAREARDLERLLADLRAVRPALQALVGVAHLVVEQRPLAELWPVLRAFLADHLLHPGEGVRVHALLDERLARLAHAPATGRLTGDEALRVVEDTVRTARVGRGRFGEPAVHVGTLRDAMSLPFRAVRVIGLAEGHLPPPPHEDPVVPDRLRQRLRVGRPGAAAPRTAADVALAALHALDHVVRDARHAVALSAPRVDVARSQREPSSILLEAAAALGRPDRLTGQPARIPDLRALRRDAFGPARRAALDVRRATPVTASAWLDAVARGGLGIPPAWRAGAALDLDRIAALRAAPGGDGLLGDPALAVPGLTPEWPLSPSALETLVQCPRLFLFRRLLRLDEPAEAPSVREIGQPYYGALVHRVAEAFFTAHGHEFCGRAGTLAGWQAALDTVVEQEFERFLESYPLAGGAVRRVQRERLRQDVHELLEFEWATGACRFVAAERSFGHDAPVALAAGGRSLFVRGRIDRLEVAGDVAVVRDLKTGRAHPRIGAAAEPDASLDLQIAVYALVVARLAEAWGVPGRLAASYLYVGRTVDQRDWLDFHASLETPARAWLAAAAELLAARAFPHTPDADDCRYCAFRPVCGDDVHEQARSVLRAGGPGLDGFRALKGVEPGPR